MWFSMSLAMLIGLAYLVWLAWAEGWRLWVVIGVMILVALIGGVAHVAMGLARARDGLEQTGEGNGTEEGSS
jgi:uncharacterized membrane protein